MAPRDEPQLFKFVPGMASTGILAMAIIGAFWGLADPRGEIRDIKGSFLSIREHEEFVRRFTSDISRVEIVNAKQTSTMVTKDEMSAHLHADEVVIATMQKRMDRIQAEVDQLTQRSLIQPPPNVSRPP